MNRSSNNYNKPWLIATAHFLGWLLFFSIPFFTHDGHRHMPPHGGPRHMNRDVMLYSSIVTNVFLIGVFYLNILWLCPVFTKEKRYGKFLLLQLAIGVVYFISVKGIISLLIAKGEFVPLFMQSFNYILIVLVAFCYSLIKETMRVENMQKEKENEALKSELSFLRWQISPHFLFNVLNNMVSLAHVRSDKLEGMLLNLSSLMRYMLYENDDHKVTLETEAQYLESYIRLQHVRFGSEVSVQSAIHIEPNGSQQMIEPMLLIPFIENAFKHGTGIPAPEIIVVIHFGSSMVTMTVKNKYLEQQQYKKDGTHGIGLVNVKRRLNLLYPRLHSLDIVANDGWYIATLGINIG